MRPISAGHKRVGNRIKELRKGKGLTQEDLAFEVGIDRSYMGFIERGEKNPTLDIFLRIAKALNVPLEGLFKGIR